MDRETAREKIKRDIPCTDYLKPAPNYNSASQTGYCCPIPICGSGTHGHNSTGAVKYYKDTNTWYCHSCNNGGDVIDIYAAQTGSDHNAALHFLAAQIGITIDSRGATAEHWKNDRTERPQSDKNSLQDKYLNKQVKAAEIEPQSPTKEMADFTAYYKACSEKISDPAAISYLQNRKISIETAQRFNIGFDPAADPANAPGATADEYKAHPAPRIIAPCTKDFYIARSIDPETPKAFKAPNPKGTHTKLFNAAALYNADIVFITEGIFDALSFLEAGQAAIALNSKGNGKLLLKQLQEKPTEAAFIIVPDNDSDPKTAADTIRQAEELNSSLQAMNLQSIVYNVAGIYHDANEALQQDPAAFEQNIAEAIREAQRDDITGFLEKITTEAYKPYKTGLNFFDELLGGGIIQQSLLLLMAAPGTGKTTLAQQIAETMAEARKPVIYFNFEMSKEQMLSKAISAKLYHNGGDKTALQILQGYNWTDSDREKITAVIEEYRQENYPYIKYNPAGTSSELNDLLQYLTATGEAAKAKGEPAPAAVIDYLHLIKSKSGLDIQELIKQAITGLKQYAVNYNTFVIGIVATNRASNKGGKLTMESARDSSNIEYTADYQISLNYNDIDSGKVKPDEVEKIAELQQAKRRAMILRVLKSRFSQPGKSAQILFDAAHNIFYGTCDDFIPPAGFTLDNNAPAFDEKPQTMIRI